MHQYTVLNASGDGTQVLLRHSEGGYHLASAADRAPPFGACLEGEAPALGVQVLVSPNTGAVFQLKFERLDCKQPSVGTAL